MTTPDLPPVNAPHDYLSTACFHGEHDYCSAPTVSRDGPWSHIGPSYSSERDAPKAPAQCKFCKAPCRCQCHSSARTSKMPPVAGLMPDEPISEYAHLMSSGEVDLFEPVEVATYHEARPYIHLSERCPSLKRAVARGCEILRTRGRVEDLDETITLCGWCKRKRP